MEEGHVTVDGTTHAVPQPFMVIATQNPIEQAGTYRLPEAQLDRFLMKTVARLPRRRGDRGDAAALPTSATGPGWLRRWSTAATIVADAGVPTACTSTGP